MGARYGHARVKRGLIHFLLGKGASAIAGFSVLLLIVRELSIQEFGAYSILIGFVEIFTTVSGLGLAHALLRYVPELYAKHFQKSLNRFVMTAVTLRTAILISVGLLAYYFSSEIAFLVGLGSMADALKVFLLVAMLRSSTHFISQVLESTLHQSAMQIGFLTATLSRLIGVFMLLNFEILDLVNVILVEAVSEALSLVVMLAGMFRVLRDQRNHNPNDSGYWLKENLRQVVKFAISGYAQHLVITPYGGNTNRLVGGHMLAVSVMAAYGFAHSIYEYIKRYMPAQLLIGIIRPLVIARYSERNDFQIASNTCNQVMQINILLMLMMLVILVVGGEQLILAVSANKYGVNTLFILLALLIVLLLETRRQQLELLVQVIEKYHILIYSNILLASSVILAIGLVPLFGAIAFPLANALGLFVANEWVRRQLNASGFIHRHAWVSSIKLFCNFLLAISVGMLAEFLGQSWFFAVILACLAYCLSAYFLSRDELLNFVANLSGEIEEMPLLSETRVSNKPLKIAFGVLSSKQSASAIDDIAKLVYPHPVYVHHDFRKVPDFSPESKNIYILKNSLETAWGDWSLVEASYLLMAEAMQDPDVTHFQLMSESDLLVKPLDEFENYIKRVKPDVMIDLLPLTDNRAVFSHGWRYLSQNKFVSKILNKATRLLAEGGHQHSQGVNIRLIASTKGLIKQLVQAIAKRVLMCAAVNNKATLANIGLNHLAIGGQWFGASRRIVDWLLSTRNQLVTFTQYYQKVHIPDESFFHTLISNANYLGIIPKVHPSNHVLFWDGCNSGPDIVTMENVGRVEISNKFFSRKFNLSRDDKARKYFIEMFC